ncbi:MAG: hypothetical protein E7334_02190 [Clostridiales bacterium]|nr:hypothetical protein [Clostridiales bacterium]
MNIRQKNLDYDKVMALESFKHHKPMRQIWPLAFAIRLLANYELLLTGFKYTQENMDSVKGRPALYLMNHSCFLDLQIASRLIYPKRFSVVCTTDGFVGKALLMRLLGCIPTRKFVSDLSLISDIRYALNELKTNVLMFPEAGYTFDGTATALPGRFGVVLKKLNVPIVVINTRGAFLRQPLYNGLKKRRVNISAHMKCLLTPEKMENMSVNEIDELLQKEFTFDGFKWQQENGIRIKETFRADGLERILYKCAHCGIEGKMQGKGTKLVCKSCGKEYELDEYGFLKAAEGKTEFSHIPDWYMWQRRCVKEEIENGNYGFDIPVNIAVLKDGKALYTVGEGRLSHCLNGFTLTGCGGKLNYSQSPLSSYSLNSDYYWYKIGDVIGIGNNEISYYCFPKNDHPVAKTRLAAEEMYKILKQRPTLGNRTIC